MAKSIRTLKADFRRDEVIGSCSRDARLMFLLLITYADDHGRFRAHPALLASELYPYDDDIDRALVAAWLTELCATGRVRKYTNGSQEYGYIVNWSKHQRVDNAARSELPNPTECDEIVENPTESGDRRTAANLGESPLERKGKERSRKGSFYAPTVSETTDSPPDDQAPDGAEQKPRKRNEIWDALTAVFGEAATRSEQSHRGKIVQSLTAAGATPEDIAIRAQEHRRRWPNVSCTEASLERHWSSMADARPLNHRERMAARRAGIAV